MGKKRCLISFCQIDYERATSPRSAVCGGFWFSTNVRPPSERFSRAGLRGLFQPIIHMSCKKLEIWQLARKTSIEIHELSLTLPKFELYEQGSQIRRSSKTVRSAIVEGYGRRFYKQGFTRYIIYALSSNDETTDHLETLFETKSLSEETTFQHIQQELELLGKKRNNFLKALNEGHQSPR